MAAAPRQETTETRLGARRIYEALKGQIEAGVYAPGSAMPSTRMLAAELGVARSTVTAAYDQLLSEGFVEGRQGARTVVAPLRPIEAVAEIIPNAPRTRQLSAYGERIKGLAHSAPRPAGRTADFRYGDLAVDDFPVMAWRRAVVAAAMQRPEHLSYGDPCGSPRLRAALQTYLWRARGIRCDPSQIVIVSGSQQGLDLCARLLLDPGNRFVIENPCYAMARQVFSAGGALPISIPVDRDGLKTELLPNLEAKLAYVTPSHQFPLGGVMPIARRRQLVNWALTAGAYVIEDDYDSEYRYDIKPVSPLYALEGAANVIYLGTVSKTLSPALRLGYLVVPPELQAAFATAKRLADRHTPLLEQEALATLLDSGVYDRHVRKVRRRNAERRMLLLEALHQTFGPAVMVEGEQAGLHVVVWFRQLRRSDEARLVDSARSFGVGVHPVSPLFDPQISTAQPDRIGLVMGYASLDAQSIRDGVRLLGQAVGSVTAT
ncbi:PLP-dependent aminotransferase family protein [Phenylobacterium sp. LjRoot225]|uniref:MocR-like pyridoxine biosynthesis transcription factor PdxR n=1 Tax=Phenylobacterium sp. LjRoot225 TaxID=3342285 RepID=UPI003ED0BE1F